MRDELCRLLSAAELHLSPDRMQRLERYHDLLLTWNVRMDLTNVPADEMPLRHYADSLLPLAHKAWFPQGAALIDVGTGAGFPGLPLAIARPDMQVCLLDALRKRCDFLEEVVKETGLQNVLVVHGRAEDAARGVHRQRYDVAVARAVAPLSVLAEYLLPFVKVGGNALCWKGPAVDGELRDAGRALRALGAVAGDRLRLPLPGFEHYVQELKKQAVTPAAYPRKAGTPAKKPL